MAASVATPLERQFSTIAGLAAMNSSSGQGLTQITLEFDLERDIDAAAQDVQSSIAAAGGQLPPNMPIPPTFRKVNPADSPDPLLRAHLADAPALRPEPLRPGPRRPAHLDHPGRRAGGGVRRAEVRGADRARPAGARGARDRPRRGRRRDPRRELEPPDRRRAGPRARLHRRGDRRARRARRTSGTSSIAFRNGAPGAALRRRRRRATASRTSGPPPGTGRTASSSARSCSPSSASPARTRWRSRRSVRELLPLVQQQLPAAARLAVLYDRSESIRGVGARREVHARAHPRPRRPRHLPVPAEPARHPHPEPRAPGVARRHVRAHAGARVLARQPLAHGAHARGRLRRRRRDRDAREHRAAHGAWASRRSRPPSAARRRSRSRSSR